MRISWRIRIMWLISHQRSVMVVIPWKVRCVRHLRRRYRLWGLSVQLDNGNGSSHSRVPLDLVSYLVSWCFEPNQPQRITPGLNTNFTLSPSYLFHKSSYHKSSYHKVMFFLALFEFRGHLTREPASSRGTHFILRTYTGTDVSHSQRR